MVGMVRHSLKRVTRLAEVALPLGFDGSVKLPKTHTTLVNCWNSDGKIIVRPGMNELNTTGLVARGQFVWNDNLYQVVSTSLIKITDVTTGAYSTIGTIAGTEDIDSAVGFNHIVIISKGGNGYTLDSSDTLTQITDPDFLPSDSVNHINGRFMYIPTDGSPAFFSNVGDGATIETLSFFDAEELPDKNKVGINLNNVEYIGGTDSFELFRDQGASPVPYVRLSARVSYGYIGGILEYSNTFLFIGREKDQDVGIFAMDQGTAIKISNERVDDILITYTPSQLASARTSRFKWNGYDIGTFVFPNHAFGYIQGTWFELTTQIGNESKPWEANFITHYQGKYYIAHKDKIGVLEDIPTDYGNTFEKAIQGGFEEDVNFTVNGLGLSISQGYNAAVGSVFLSLSDDGVLFGPKFSRKTGAIGNYADQLEWDYPGGLGYYYMFMGYRISSTENINFSASKLRIDV